MTPELAQQLAKTLQSIDALLKGIPNKISAVAEWLRTGKEEVEKITDASKKAADAAEKHAAAQEKVTKKINETKRATDTSNASLNDQSSIVGASLAKYGISLDSLTKSAKGLENQLLKTVDKMKLEGTDKKVAIVATGFSILSTSVLNVSNSFKEWAIGLDLIGNKTSSLAENDIENLKNGLNDLGKITGLGSVTSLLGKALDMFGKFSKQVNGIRQMENGLIGLRSQFGGFAREGSKLTFIENLPKEMSRFNDVIEGTATSMNLAIEEVEQFALKLQKIPGAYDKIINSGKKSEDQIRFLEKAMRVARGTTGDFGDSLKSMDLEFRQFGEATNNSLDYLSRMYEMANALSVPFNDFRETVDNIVKGFSSLGNTSKSATELVSGLSRSLMNTGIGIEPTKRIIEGITGSMQQMSIAQKAFLSQQTGGAGGLQGAFQIEKMLSEGNIRGVYEKMEQALKQQFGGRIVSLDEAAQDSNAASQFMKQRAFLEEGPFGQLVKNPGDANKLLEAMSKGTGPTPDLLGRGDAAMGGALEADRSIQEKQKDSLVSVANTTKALFRESQIHTAIMARSSVLPDDVRAIIQKREKEARGMAVGASAPSEDGEDIFKYSGSHNRVMDKLLKVSSTVIGTPHHPDSIPTDGEVRRMLGLQPGASAPRPVNPDQVTGSNSNSVTLPGTSASQQQKVQLLPDELRLILSSDAGKILYDGSARVRSAESRATGGAAP